MSAAIAPLRSGDHRVEVDLGDLREVRDQFGRPARICSASAHRSTGGAPRTPRRISAARIESSIDSASSAVDRREPEGDVLEHLHQHTAEPEGDDLPERRVGDRADDDLLAPGGTICCTCTPSIRASGVVRPGVRRRSR